MVHAFCQEFVKAATVAKSGAYIDEQLRSQGRWTDDEPTAPMDIPATETNDDEQGHGKGGQEEEQDEKERQPPQQNNNYHKKSKN